MVVTAEMAPAHAAGIETGRSSPDELPPAFLRWDDELDEIERSVKRAHLEDKAEFERERAGIEAEMAQLQAAQETGLQDDIHRYMIRTRANFENMLQRLRAARLDQIRHKYDEKAKSRDKEGDSLVLEHYKKIQELRRGGAVGKSKLAQGQPDEAPRKTTSTEIEEPNTSRHERSASADRVARTVEPMSTSPALVASSIAHPELPPIPTARHPVPSRPTTYSRPSESPAPGMSYPGHLHAHRNGSLPVPNGAGPQPVSNVFTPNISEPRHFSYPNGHAGVNSATEFQTSKRKIEDAWQSDSQKRARTDEADRPYRVAHLPGMPLPESRRVSEPRTSEPHQTPEFRGVSTPIGTAQVQQRTPLAHMSPPAKAAALSTSAGNSPSSRARELGREPLPNGAIAGTPAAIQPQDASTPKPTSRSRSSMTFDEVYCGGKPKHYHTIVEFPPKSNKRYILFCEEHMVHFKDNPIAGAAKHLFSVQHPGHSKRHDHAIATLGFLIPDCTAEMASKNNAMAAAAYARGYKPLNLNRLTRVERLALGRSPEDTSQTGRPSAADGSPPQKMLKTRPNAPLLPPKTTTKEFRGINNPVAGELYFCYWSPHKTWYVIMPLPVRGDIECAGMHGTIWSLGLMKHGPSSRCYKVDRVNQKILGWAEGFEDGGPYMNNREFPAVYFDGKRQVGWVAAKHIAPFDFETPHWRSVPHFHSARDEFARIRGFNHYEDMKAKGAVPQTGLAQPALYSTGAVRPAATQAPRDSADAAVASAPTAVGDVEMGDRAETVERDADDTDVEMMDTAVTSPEANPGSSSSSVAGSPVPSKSAPHSPAGGKHGQAHLSPRPSPTRAESHSAPRSPPPTNVTKPRTALVSARPSPNPKAATESSQATKATAEAPSSRPSAPSREPVSQDETVKDSISVAVPTSDTPQSNSQSPTESLVATPAEPANEPTTNAVGKSTGTGAPAVFTESPVEAPEEFAAAPAITPTTQSMAALIAAQALNLGSRKQHVPEPAPAAPAASRARFPTPSAETPANPGTVTSSSTVADKPAGEQRLQAPQGPGPRSIVEGAESAPDREAGRKSVSFLDILGQDVSPRQDMEKENRALARNNPANSMSPTRTDRTFESSLRPRAPSAQPLGSSLASQQAGPSQVGEKTLPVPSLILRSNGPRRPSEANGAAHAVPGTEKRVADSKTVATGQSLSRQVSGSPAPLTVSTTGTTASVASNSAPASASTSITASPPLSFTSTLMNIPGNHFDRWRAVRSPSVSSPTAAVPGASSARNQPPTHHRASFAVTSTPSPSLSSFGPFSIKREEGVEREVAFEAAAYSRTSQNGEGEEISYVAAPPEKPFLRLVVSNVAGASKAVIQSVPESAVKGTIDPLRVVELKTTVVDDVTTKVTITNRDGAATEYLTFTKHPETTLTKMGKAHARKFCTWVRNVNSDVHYVPDTDPLRRSSIMSGGSLNSPATPATPAAIPVD